MFPVSLEAEEKLPKLDMEIDSVQRAQEQPLILTDQL
jgi:hypothetical protein